MNIEKCHFCVFEVEALGHKISKKGLLPLEKNVDAIENWIIPRLLRNYVLFLE